MANARRMIASLLARGEPVADWLANEIWVHGIRENAAVLAAMEIPQHRQVTVETYSRDHPDRLETLNDLLGVLT